MARKDSILGGDASEDLVCLLSFLDKVDLLFSSLGVIIQVKDILFWCFLLGFMYVDGCEM
jgi:hypothetical protein